MKKVKQIMMTVCIFASAYVWSACAGVNKEKCPGHVAKNKVVAGSPAPRKIWVPEYYVRSGHRYYFVEGHYRRVLFKKNYWKRSLRTSQEVEVSAR